MDYLRLVPAAWRLRFPLATEKEFIDYYNVTTLSAVRIALAVGVVLFALFGVLDLYSAPLSTSTAWFYRFAVGCPAIFVALVFSYITPLRAFLQVVMSAMCLVAGLAVILIIKHTQPSEPGLRPLLCGADYHHDVYGLVGAAAVLARAGGPHHHQRRLLRAHFPRPRHCPGPADAHQQRRVSGVGLLRGVPHGLHL
ncbi:hypothetical protein ACFQT0_21240 [Hymenobacter humi]|uniref:Amino acid transporter transmembrane domain-containing protein n=1 Tax=Hymenobacter humi TaxID=1411620 RepID=A0ABW2UB23_9BACT